MNSYDELAERIERKVKQISPARKWWVARENQLYGRSSKGYWLRLEISVDGILRGAEQWVDPRYCLDDSYLESVMDRMLFDVAMLIKRDAQ